VEGALGGVGIPKGLARELPPGPLGLMGEPSKDGRIGPFGLVSGSFKQPEILRGLRKSPFSC